MYKNTTYFLSTILFVIFFSVSSFAQNITEKGFASVELNRSTCRDGKPVDRNKHFEAIEKAKKSAWEKYTSTLSSDMYDAYSSSEQKYLSDLDSYITDYIILSTDCSKTDRNYQISIRATINEARFTNSLVKKSSPSKRQQNLQGQAVLALVIPRKTTDEDIFDERVTKQSMTKNALSADEVTTIDEGAVSITENSTQMQSITTGGKTKRQATDRTYDIGDLDDAYAQISDVLSKLGMMTVEAAMLEDLSGKYFLKEVIDQFSGKVGDFGANISPRTRVKIGNLMNEVNFGDVYLLIGTVDSSIARKDLDTGAYKSDVLVSMQLYEINPRFGPMIVASVGPEIKSAFGETDVLSEKNALKKAVNEATNSLMLKL